jgi:hypothetical protein
MRKKVSKVIAFALALVLVLVMTTPSVIPNLVTSAEAAKQTTVYGKVTAISGSKVTIALGTMKKPSGVPPSGSAKPSETPSAKPSEKPSASPGAVPDLLTLTGKSMKFTISSTKILTKESMEPNNKTSSSSSSTKASLSDISVGSILKVTYKTSTKKPVAVVIMKMGQH